MKRDSNELERVRNLSAQFAQQIEELKKTIVYYEDALNKYALGITVWVTIPISGQSNYASSEDKKVLPENAPKNKDIYKFTQLGYANTKKAYGLVTRQVFSDCSQLENKEKGWYHEADPIALGESPNGFQAAAMAHIDKLLKEIGDEIEKKVASMQSINSRAQ